MGVGLRVTTCSGDVTIEASFGGKKSLKSPVSYKQLRQVMVVVEHTASKTRRKYPTVFPNRRVSGLVLRRASFILSMNRQQNLRTCSRDSCCVSREAAAA